MNSTTPSITGIREGDTISFLYTEYEATDYGYGGDAGYWSDVPLTAPVICKDGVLGVEVENCGTVFLGLKELKDVKVISPSHHGNV